MIGVEITIPLAVALLIAAWLLPYEALGFLIAGSIPYYAILHVTGAEPSGELTGLVFGAAGGAATLRLLSLPARASLVFSSPYVLLYALFVGIWYLRWYLDPPSALGDQDAGFGDRAQVYMVVFSAVPFLGGMAIRSREEVMRTFRAIAVFGGVGSMVVLAYWLSGAPSLGPTWSAKWEPIRHLTGIVIAFELGVGVVAYLLVTDGLSRRAWAMIRWIPVAVAVAEIVRVGQRGPFIFLMVALLAYLGLGTRRAMIRAVLSMAAAVAVIAFVSLEIADSYHATRVVDAENYTSEENGDRLELIGLAAGFIAERPIAGWGGSLLGLPVGAAGSYGWNYSHVMLLDPMIETGLLGAIPFWLMYILATSRFVRVWRSVKEVDLPLKAIGNLFLYTMLESQVSGHVSTSKHAWFATGMLCGVTEWLRREVPRATIASEAEPPFLSRRSTHAHGPALPRTSRKP